MTKESSMCILEKTLVFLGVPIFEGMASDDIAVVAAHAGEARFNTGDIIHPDSPEGACAHLIVDGSVEHTVDGRVVEHIERGGGFGMGIVFGHPDPSERIRVLEPTHTLVLSKGDWEKVVADHPQIALKAISVLYGLFIEQTRAGAD